MNIQCLIIHLERAHERRVHLQKLIPLIKMETQIIDAVDARKISDAELDCYTPNMLSPSYHSPLKSSEIACFLSHRKSWEYIVKENLDAALVLEDDADISESLFNKSLSLVIENICTNDFIRFPIQNTEELRQVINEKNGHTLYEPTEIKLGMVAQIITRDAAKALLDATKNFDRPVDCFLQMCWVHKVRVLSVWPSGIEEVSSKLGGSVINHKVIGLEKLRREIKRPIYRYKISKLAKNSES